MKKKKQLDRSSVTSFDKLKMVDDFDESVSGQLETTATTKIVILQSNGCSKRFWSRKQNTFLVRSPSITTGIHGQLTFVSIFNGFPSITTFLGNALILVALHKESSLHPPSKLLLCSFAITDVCVGLIVEPLYVTLLATVAN